jgi:hypothetical protein
MWIMYLIPVIAIAGILIYTFVARARIQQAVAEGKGPLLFHEGFAAYFPSLNPEEYLIGVWQGLAYTGSQSGASQVAGALLNEVSSKAIGISKYTPMVFVGLTSAGRVLIAQEYSEMGDRGNYNEVHVWAPGATAVAGPSAVPDHSGPPPKNPFNPAVQLELAMLSGPDGSRFPGWLSPQSLEVTGQTRSIASALPIGAGQASAVWSQALQVAGGQRVSASQPG